MSVFFGGRLLVSPATASMVDDSAMRNQNLTVPNVLALVGTAEGGEPNTPLRFGSPSEARALLRSGPLLDAVERAFDPSPQTYAPSTGGGSCQPGRTGVVDAEGERHQHHQPAIHRLRPLDQPDQGQDRNRVQQGQAPEHPGRQRLLHPG